MAPLHHHFEALGLAGIEDHCPLLDRGFGLGALCAEHSEIEMRFEGKRVLIVGLARIGESGRGIPGPAEERSFPPPTHSQPKKLREA